MAEAAGGGAGKRPDGHGSPAQTLQRWLAAPESSVLAVILALYVYLILSGQMKTFASDFNRDNLARSISLQSIFAIGELLVILTGGIDLSLGSLVAFSG